MKTHKVKTPKKTWASIFAEFARQPLRQKIYIVIYTIALIVIQTIIFFPNLLFAVDFPIKFIERESKLGRFSMNYPTNWFFSELPYGNHGDMETIIVSSPFTYSLPVINVARKEFSSSEVSDVASWGEMRNYQEGKYLSTKSLKKITNQNFSGLIREYNYEIVGFSRTEIHCFDVYTLYNEIGYQFSFCSEEKDWLKIHDMFLKIIQSISFSA